MSFSFGSPSSAPANTGLTGFSFGANKPATTGFGLTATTQASTGLFGGTATSAAPAFGATTTPAFGATSTPAFGATATPAFGATATPAFGATATPAFGATTTPAFGATAAPAFGATTTPAFGATSAAPPAFGASTASTGLAGGLNFGAGSNTATTGLSFGTATTTASTGLGGFGFGSTTTTPQLGFGLLGANTSTTANTGLFGSSGAKLGTTNTLGAQPSASAAPSLGLGGISTTSTGFGANTTNTTDGKGEPPKQTKLPNEISTTVDSFKEFVKKQKSLSSDISKVSIKPLHKVSREVESVISSAHTVRGAVRSGRAGAARLRAAAAAALRTAEAVPHYPPGTVLEGSAPPDYVKELISELEQQLLTFRRQLDLADKQLLAAPKLLTEQELFEGMRRMHGSLVALAARLAAARAGVAAQKDQYLHLRKYLLKDNTDVFQQSDALSSIEQILKDSETQSKKSKLSNLGDFPGSALLSDPKATLSNIQQLAGPSPFSNFGLSNSFTGADLNTSSNWQPSQPQATMPTFNTSFGNLTAPAASSPFQLQKPPGKRGKQ